jgi:hypothetical protein
LAKFVTEKCHLASADLFRFRAGDLVLQKVECRSHLYREVITAESAHNFPSLKKESPVACSRFFMRQQRCCTPESFMSIQLFGHG